MTNIILAHGKKKNQKSKINFIENNNNYSFCQCGN
jgi:hypothetical protein